MRFQLSLLHAFYRTTADHVCAWNVRHVIIRLLMDGACTTTEKKTEIRNVKTVFFTKPVIGLRKPVIYR